MRTGGWEEPYDAYVVVASMLLDLSVAMAAFTHLFMSFRNQLQSPYLVDVILALKDALEGERVLVHRSLTIRHSKIFVVRVQYIEPDLDLRLEADNRQSTHLQLTYTNLYLLYKTNLNWDVL